LDEPRVVDGRRAVVGADPASGEEAGLWVARLADHAFEVVVKDRGEARRWLRGVERHEVPEPDGVEDRWLAPEGVAREVRERRGGDPHRVGESHVR